MLSQKVRYALRALLHLVEHGGTRTIDVTELAENQAIPRKFLELIMTDLRKRGIVTSRRGPKGGFALARNPDEIMFAEIIRAIDGPIALVPCASKNFYAPCGDCKDEASCAIRRIMEEVRNSAIKILENRSLGQAARAELAYGSESASAS